MIAKLDQGQRNIIRLVAKDSAPDGWTPIAPMIYRHLEKTFPRELLHLEWMTEQEKGRARLTEKGKEVASAMQYL